MEQLHVIKLVYTNGIMEDVKQGVVITRDGAGIGFEATNLLPHEMLLLVSITLHQLLKDTDAIGDDFMSSLIILIKALIKLEDEKGDVLQ